MAWNEPGPNRDPWNQGSGGRNNGGPPDLDELLKRFKARLGGKGGGGGHNGGVPGLPKGMFGLGAVLVALLWMCTGIYVVDEQERAVELVFGEYSTTKEPGMRWHYPWPVASKEVINVTQVRQVTDEQSMLTRDENIITVELTVQYRVSSAEDYLFNVDDPDTTLRQATKSAVRETVGRSDMDFILTEGRQVIGDQTKQQLQTLLDEYRSGLVVTEVNLQQAQPPDAVQSAFADAIKAREDQERVKNEAEAYANDRLPRARGQAARDIEQASAYRDQVIARAKGDAARFTQLLTEYRAAPKVTRERLYLDTMSDMLASTSKVLVDTSKGSPFYYLPLDRLQGEGGGSTVDAQGYLLAPGVASGRNSGTAGTGTTDPSRSRERGRQ